MKPKRASAQFSDTSRIFSVSEWHTSCIVHCVTELNSSFIGGGQLQVNKEGCGTMSTYSNPLTDYSPQMEFSGGFGGRHHRRYANQILSDSQEMEFAAEFLEVANEEELEQFLGDLIGGIGSTLGKIVNSPVGKAVGGVLKDVAKTALPIAGGALGTFVGGPIGGMIGSNLASIAGSALLVWSWKG